MRYAGRVEPVNAQVTLNGEPLKVWPGGVFTGVRDLDGEAGQTWRFEARAGGQATSVERVIQRPAPPEPAPRWPLSFFKYPVRPTGDYWLRPTDKLEIKLFASTGHRAQLKVGEKGSWITMAEAAPDPERGGVYALTLTAPPAVWPPRLQTVFFRIAEKKGKESEDGLEEGRGNEAQTQTLQSRLRIATLPAGRTVVGTVSTNVGTFFKDKLSATRWGNWIQGTSFPILEGRGERIRTGFGRGETGWLEAVQVKISQSEDQKLKRPRLGKPSASQARQTLTLAWPTVNTPVACVFSPRANPGGGEILRVSLPGAAGLAPGSLKLTGDGDFDSVRLTEGDAKSAPALEISLKRPLWGYAMKCDAEHGLRIMARTQPHLAATADKPLKGLRVMLDAGHGGDSLGERGPSGLLEADLNLVQAAWLERDLAAMGAEVRQIRRADTAVELDERVDMALAWNPDLFVSLHHNSVPYTVDPSSGSGPQLFYHYPHSQALAQEIARTITEATAPEQTPRVLQQVFRVNRNVSLCPSVLVESAFICNPEDEIKLRQTETLKTSARAIARGIRDYLSGFAGGNLE
jgi:N-acetylmuramoyl-L-alanine amidase